MLVLSMSDLETLLLHSALDALRYDVGVVTQSFKSSDYQVTNKPQP